MKVKSESEVAQSCPTLSDPMDCSLPDFSVHGPSPQLAYSKSQYPTADFINLAIKVVVLLECNGYLIESPSLLSDRSYVKPPSG